MYRILVDFDLFLVEKYNYYHLDAGDENLLLDAHVLEERGLRVDGCPEVGLDGSPLIDGVADDVDDSKWNERPKLIECSKKKWYFKHKKKSILVNSLHGSHFRSSLILFSL